VTGVVPSARVTVPSVGSVSTVMVGCDGVKFGSVGAAMPIGVAVAFSSTARLGEDTVGAMVAICSPRVAAVFEASKGLPAPSVMVAPLSARACTARSAVFCPP
jgi:hypothetical protein